jgi:hypothetical protein
MKELKRTWQTEGRPAKASYDIIDGMPRLRVEERADSKWSTWQTVKVGREKFKFQPKYQVPGHPGQGIHGLGVRATTAEMRWDRT